MKRIKSIGATASAVVLAAALAGPAPVVWSSLADEPVQADAGTAAAGSEEQGEASADAAADQASQTDSKSDEKTQATDKASDGADASTGAEDAQGSASGKDAKGAKGEDGTAKASDADDADGAADAKEEDSGKKDDEAKLKKLDKAIDKARKASSKAGSAAGELYSLESELAAARAHYDEVKAQTAKLKKKLKKVKKQIKAAEQDVQDVQDLIATLEDEIGASKKVGLFEVLVGRASFDDIDSRVYLLEKVRDDRSDAVVRLEKLQAKKEKTKKKLKASIAEQKEAQAEAKRLGNQAAFKIEKQTSKVRAADDDAAAALDDIDTSLDGAKDAKAEIKATKSNHTTARKSVDKSVGDWYALVDDAPEAEDAISFGEGADFALSEEDFVAKWGAANDQFFGSGPLAGYGEAIAKSAYAHKVDPRLCAAVSIIESSGGVYCIRPYNAWGWGAADSNPYALAAEWGSWEEAIEAWHEGMATSTTGLATASTLDELGSIYCSSAEWSANIATEMEKISALAEQVEKQLAEQGEPAETAEPAAEGAQDAQAGSGEEA